MKENRKNKYITIAGIILTLLTTLIGCGQQEIEKKSIQGHPAGWAILLAKQ